MSDKLTITSKKVLEDLLEPKSVTNLKEDLLKPRTVINIEDVPLTFKDFTSMFRWPNMGSLRKMAYESEVNGLSSAFIKFQKRRLVLPVTLFSLLKGGR